MSDLHLELLITLLGFLGGGAIGFAARKAHFCTLGAIEECYYGSERSRLRMWLLAIGTAVALTQLLDMAGYIELERSFRLGSRIYWLGAILGGVLFGFGMALVGTCAFGMLVRLGGGDMRALIAILVTGITGFMTMSGIFARARLRYIDSVAISLPAQSHQSLNELLFGPSIQGQLMVTITIVALTAGWALTRRRFRQNTRQVLAALTIGAAIAFGWLVTSTMGQDMLYPHRPESFSFVRPIGHAILWLMIASGSSMSFLIGGVFGVPAGSFLASWRDSDVIWEAFDDAREMRRHLGGAALMGIGGVMAMGCTIGQGMTGIATLSVTSFIATAAIVSGAVLGIRFLVEGRLPHWRDLWERP